MGNYLNSPAAYMACEEMVRNPYFVDKSNVLEEILTVGVQHNKYLCITRPRRFGKTVTANMLAAFLSKGNAGKGLFSPLKIGRSSVCTRYRYQYPVIHISLNEMPMNCTSFEQYINRLTSRLIADLTKGYPQVAIDSGTDLWDILMDICIETGDRFVFVLDEWDYIFHQELMSEKDRSAYLSFLRNLLKDKPYVFLAYMTGILPIAYARPSCGTQKSNDFFVNASGESLQAVFPADALYSSGSELNMFWEYTMINEERFSDSFGFTEPEVDQLYERYLSRTENPRLTRKSLADWYDGYHTFGGGRVYNPRSVVAALSNDNLGNYWTSSGPYDEIYYYIQKNVADVRSDLALMISGEPVRCKIQEYAATSMELGTREEIFSAMVVYGFLSCDNGWLSVPNQELMGQFEAMLRKEDSLGYVHRLAKESARMVRATQACDTETMSQILSYAHDTETPILSYNSEVELAAVVNLVYLAARDDYRVEREDKAGVGYVDFIFYPERDRSLDCMILELKVDHTPEEAIAQIKDRRYALKFSGKLGEARMYTGRLLLVGIGYDRKKKIHRCAVEVLST